MSVPWLIDNSRKRKALVWTGQTFLAGVLVLFVGRSIYSNWSELGAIDVPLTVRPLWIVASAFTVWLTYALLIEAWRRILRGWNQTLSYSSAIRIWCLSNLGRYLPGKIWSVAGLAMLAHRAGVAPWTAAASAVVMQAIAIGTGTLVVAIGAPGAATLTALAAAFCLSGIIVAVLAWKPLAERLFGLLKPGVEYHPIPVGTMLLATLVTLTSWAAYGLAFLMLANGIFENVPLTVVNCIGVFAAGYIVGLLALFAPGGIGVRELVFVALLAPVVGSGGALTLSIAARLLLTGTEVSAALAALFLDRRKELSVGSAN